MTAMMMLSFYASATATLSRRGGPIERERRTSPRWSAWQGAVALAGGKTRSTLETSCSDGECELGKGRGEPVSGVDVVHAEFVVASAEVLDECVSGADDAGRAEPFEAPHRPQPGFEPSMIGFDRSVAYCSRTWHAAGSSSATTRG